MLWCSMSRVVCCLLSAALYWSSIAAQQPVARAGGNGAGPVSPTVFAMWEASISETDNRMTLDLMVLWRGSTSGWFDGMGMGTKGGATGSLRVHSLRFADGASLDLHVDTDAQIVRIQDQTIALDGANVVLIDSADVPAAVSIRTSVLSDTSLPSRFGADVLQELIQRSPELIEFARLEQN